MQRLRRVALAASILVIACLTCEPARSARLISADQFLASPGAQAFRAKRYRDALAGFQSLLQRYPDDVLILRYIGITLMRQKQYAEAIEVLERARALAPKDPVVLYFLGAALFNGGQRQQASAVLRQVRALVPGTVYAQRAGKYLQAIGQLDAEQAAANAPKPWEMTLQVGGQYDGNIVAAPDSFTGDTNGYRVFGRAGGGYHLVQEGPWRFTADGAAYRGGHTDGTFEQLDLGAFAGGLTLRYADTADEVPYALTVRYGFDLAVLDGDVFSSIHSVRSSAFANWSPYALSEAYHDVQFGDYRNEGFDADISSRNGTRNALGLKQYVFFEKRRHYLWVGYEYQINDTTGTNFEYRGHAVSGGGTVSLPWDVRLNLAAGYTRQNYIEFRSIESRKTDRVTFSVLLSKQVWEGLRVTAGYALTDENSTINVLAYDRGVATFSLIYVF